VERYYTVAWNNGSVVYAVRDHKTMQLLVDDQGLPITWRYESQAEVCVRGLNTSDGAYLYALALRTKGLPQTTGRHSTRPHGPIPLD